MSENFIIAIPSRGRHDKVITLDYIGGIDCEKFVFVADPVEAEMYRKEIKGNATVVTTGARQGYIPAFNYMLDYFPRGTNMLSIDDDVSGLIRVVFNPGGLGVPLCVDVKMCENEVYAFAVKCFSIARKRGTRLWGVLPTTNHIAMKRTLDLAGEISQFGFLVSQFLGVVVSSLRMDERLVTKGDYDFTAQHIRKFGCIARFNEYCLRAMFAENAGGCQIYRTERVSEKSVRYLIRKWPCWFKKHPTRTGEVVMMRQRRGRNAKSRRI